MHKFYKQKLYRKYHDEIWGQIASSRKFSYNKKLILLKFRDTVVRRRLRIKTKFKYFRRGFLRRLKIITFAFRRFRKLLRTSLFIKKKIKVKYFDRYHDKNIMCIKLKDLIQIAIFKFPRIKLTQSILLVWGSAKSMNIHII